MVTVASSPLSWLNGERAVVVLFIFQVLYSLPFSLWSQGFSLSLLAIASLFLEVHADSSDSLSRFKTRPGASSGILLGAVTLPTLMLSKLIQLSRALAVDGVFLQDFEYLKLQYWEASASCLSVLVLLYVTIRRAPASSNNWIGKFSFTFILLNVAVYCGSLCSSQTGFQPTFKLFLVLCHGLVAVLLIQHFLRTFPLCVSIGEALLVTSGIVLYFGDMLIITMLKLYGVIKSSQTYALDYRISRSEISVIIQGLLLGILLFPLALKFVLRIWEWLISTIYTGGRAYNDVGKSLIFFTSLGLILIVIVPSWMEFVQEFHMHPFLWVFTFVFSEPLKRLSLCIYWVCVICVSVLRFYNISKTSTTERILLRKYYHLMAVSMFLPALIYQPKFLDLAFGAALGVFLALETIRVWRIWPLGQPVHHFMNAFTDHRDSDILIVSHFSLLLGCALPIWMSSGYNDRPLAPFAGILSLGIGDTMASMVGYKYGVLRWSKSGKKTIEGTAAGITSVLAACSVLLPLLASTGYILTQHWLSLLLAVTVSGLLEAYTAQLDNAFIPLVFYSLLCL